ncbi:MAG: hypothetical protein LAO31_03875 [Acidobacteriia bacterium]|nr:hypothetical protein [Terriglobia bacterium]
MNVKLVVIAAFVIASSAAVLADDEAGNRPVVRSSENGSVYAKSVPEENYGQKGKTSVFSVGADRDTLICEYEWYANTIYIGGAGEQTLIRFGPWQRGRKPQKDHLALGTYRNGRTVREYSTAEMERLGSGLSTSVSHYTIFRRHLGFRWLKGNSYVYEVEGVSGKVFTIELETGSLTEKPAEPSAGGDVGSRAPQP